MYNNMLAHRVRTYGPMNGESISNHFYQQHINAFIMITTLLLLTGCNNFSSNNMIPKLSPNLGILQLNQSLYFLVSRSCLVCVSQDL